MTSQEQKSLSAPCGLYCGACSVYVAGRRGDSKPLEQTARRLAKYLGRMVEVGDLTCEGCLSGVIAVQCRDCLLRACVFGKGLTHCAQCHDFPCQRIIDFNNDGMRHHGEVLGNVQRQREIGLDAWIEEQDRRWRCPGCSTVVDWYASQCPNCGIALLGHWPQSLAC